jgi:2-deoxy-D-gluconate 3-dehydrogenase
MFELEGKVALVTGAATGLGAAAARALAKQGARVAVADFAESTYEDDWEVRLAMDVRDAGQRDAAVSTVERTCGGIDILVNNAGINRPAPGLNITEEAWDAHFATNVKGGFFLAQRVAPGMIARSWGRVIWMSSQSGLIGIPGQPAYCATKGAVIQAVRTLGLEWARFGLTVNSVAPTFVETNMTRPRLEKPEFRAFVLGKIPAGRLATADEIAAAVVFLASREAAMVNCHTLSVDGGWTAW